MSDPREKLLELPGMSDDILGDLETYAGLIQKWSPRINLVSRETLADIWGRHMLDSAQLFGLAPPSTKIWCDMGSGGGLPGIVVAVMAKHLAPGMSVTMIESDQRKATFLRTALRETGANGTVVAARIESSPPLGADVVSARALAQLSKLLGFAETHLKADGVALFPKGMNYREELHQALETWVFDCEEIPSATDPAAVILKISEIARA